MAYNLGPVKPQTKRAVDILGPKFHIGTVGGYADRNIAGTSTKSDHAYGLAADFMCSIPVGDALAAYAKAHAAQLDVKYIIHNRKIWSVQRASEGWRIYTGSSPHTDHVHISFNGTGSVSDPGGSVTVPQDATSGGGGSQGAGAVATAFTAPISGAAHLYDFLTSPDVWIRVALFLAGGLALIVALLVTIKNAA